MDLVFERFGRKDTFFIHVTEEENPGKNNDQDTPEAINQKWIEN